MCLQSAYSNQNPIAIWLYIMLCFRLYILKLYKSDLNIATDLYMNPYCTSWHYNPRTASGANYHTRQ